MIPFSLILRSELPGMLLETHTFRLGHIYEPLARVTAKHLFPGATVAALRMARTRRPERLMGGWVRITMIWDVEMQEPAL
jgi:hypothetical protein